MDLVQRLGNEFCFALKCLALLEDALIGESLLSIDARRNVSPVRDGAALPAEIVKGPGHGAVSSAAVSISSAADIVASAQQS